MLFRGMTIDVCIIMNGNNARELVHYLVHAHLKDVLGHPQTEGHVQEPVCAMEGFQGGQVGGFLLEVYAPEAILSIQLAEASSTT